MSTIKQFPPTQTGNYKGAFVYRLEDGYTLITMTVSVAPDETSHVTSHVYNLPVSEEAEHLQGVDLYHFAVTDGIKIQLTITSLGGIEEAWYTVSRYTVLALVSPLHLSTIRASESITLTSAIYKPVLGAYQSAGTGRE